MHNTRVELFARLFTNVVNHFACFLGTAVGAVVGQGIKNIYYRKDAGRKGNLLTAQAVGVARAILAFVVKVWNFKGAFKIGDF